MFSKKRIIYLFLFLLLIADISYSFVQHLSMPLDGDMAGGLVPLKDGQKIFNDPLGFSTLTKGFAFPNPNRFFAHRIFYDYFKNVPILLQSITNPIESIYLSSAIAKTAIQILLILLITCYITASRNIFSGKFILVAALITPLFQTNGYQTYMGIIDPSITYTFFYALPFAFLMIFYLPFFNTSYYKFKFRKNKFLLFLLFIFCIVLSFNGPILTGIILIVSLLYLTREWINNFTKNQNLKVKQRILVTFHNIPKTHLFFFILISILSLYSLYLGSNDPSFPKEIIPLTERYVRVISGLYYLLTQKIGLPLLLLTIVLNIILLKKYFKTPESTKFLNFVNWIGVFAILYIILLPLGGYRNYRPNILRYDTIIPITIALIFIYGKSSSYLIQHLNANVKKFYIIFIIIISAIYTFADQADFNKNKCEKDSLITIAHSKDKIVVLKNNCNVISWRKITDPKESELNGELLKLWRVTKDKKLYYQE